MSSSVYLKNEQITVSAANTDALLQTINTQLAGTLLTELKAVDPSLIDAQNGSGLRVTVENSAAVPVLDSALLTTSNTISSNVNTLLVNSGASAASLASIQTNTAALAKDSSIQSLITDVATIGGVLTSVSTSITSLTTAMNALEATVSAKAGFGSVELFNAAANVAQGTISAGQKVAGSRALSIYGNSSSPSTIALMVSNDNKTFYESDISIVVPANGADFAVSTGPMAYPYVALKVTSAAQPITALTAFVAWS